MNPPWSDGGKILGHFCRCSRHDPFSALPGSALENWHTLFSHPEPLLWMFEQLGNRLGLCLDFGDWHGPHRHAGLSRIAHLAESCHAKCGFSPSGEPELDGFETCLNLLHAASFAGPFTLVQGQKPAEWESLAVQQKALAPYL